MLNETHDQRLRSWVDSANEPHTPFPIQNLPFAVFCRTAIEGPAKRIGVAIGDRILDMHAASKAGLFEGAAAEAGRACEQSTLNALMRLGAKHWSALRLSLSRHLRSGSTTQQRVAPFLVESNSVQFEVPAAIGDFTDFFASVHHARRAGATVRPDDPLLPNYHWVPIAYHGRSSSIRVSGHSLKRPNGQVQGLMGEAPQFTRTAKLDYEAELGLFVGPGNELGEPIELRSAEEHIFGACMLNDWSARDIQSWEAKPLGPFLAKNFATVISPWTVTWEALAPFRVTWASQERDVLSYLDSPDNSRFGGVDIEMEVWIETRSMRASGTPRARLSRTSTRHCYWTPAQMIAHHTSNGCNLLPGDLIGTGTQSGPTIEESGCLLEMTAGGKHPLTLPNGERRAFVEDGDAIYITGGCAREGYRFIGFGESASMVQSKEF